MFTYVYMFTYSILSYPFLQDWDRESTPLQPKGEAAKFPGKPCEKIQGTEGQTIYIQLDVEGSPPPTIGWFKVHTTSKYCDIASLKFDC